MSDVPKCAGRIYTGGFRPPWRQCQNEGTLEHDGEMFCEQHHPPTEDNSAVRAAKDRVAEAALKGDLSGFGNYEAAIWFPSTEAKWEFLSAMDDLRRLKGEG